MMFQVNINDASQQHPDYEFVTALTPSAQKAAFHVRRNGEDFCLKIIAPTQSLERVQREVLAMQTLNHPNVARVVEYEYSARGGETRHYLVEEFVAGTDLSHFLAARGNLSLEQIKNIFVPLCSGLNALAENSIVHRDLKPSNIRVDNNENPVIIDFGLARLLDMESLTATVEGAMLGTPKYFAPEQLRGTKRDIDPRTDLYALGVILYEAAVGKHPSVADSPMTFDELDEAICTSEDFKSDPNYLGLNPTLKLVLQRLLEKERARRPASAAMVGNILNGLGAQQ
ncbi:serine/threonine-protein kinase [Paracoccus methylarcula]|uniref:Serine/threonine protein kinase n=1 Tax=Paracoccus methylarcula TaxID=72022 RepID=A0A422R1C4_9RHOB|nr:serine/threonine-protein kinase [Paracoccus methylarcula]RNF36057.1 serine/threonine protein kinase [Paracoccus methylarcula]